MEQEKPGVVHKTFKSFLLSKKLWTTIIALVFLWVAYWKEVDYLYSFASYPIEIAPQLITAFIGLTRDFMVAFTAVVLAFCGIEGVVSWKHGTESVVNQVSQAINEHKVEEKKVYYNTKEDDYHIGDPLLESDEH